MIYLFCHLSYMRHSQTVPLVNQEIIFTARCSYANAVLGAVILSVPPSVTSVLCDKTKQRSADILIPNKRAITLVFGNQQ